MKPNKLKLTAAAHGREISFEISDQADIHEVLFAMSALILALEYHKESLINGLHDLVDQLEKE